MSGSEYANIVAAYIARRFGGRGVKVYREIRVGKSIIGKNRCIDVFCVCEATNKAVAVECKFQDSEGTVDEKIPYTLDDLAAMPMAGCIAYAGKGFSAGVLHMLRASTRAAYCLPRADQDDTTVETKELDHLLAMHFGWWDVFVEKKRPITATPAKPFERTRANRLPRFHRDQPEGARLRAPQAAAGPRQADLSLGVVLRGKRGEEGGG